MEQINKYNFSLFGGYILITILVVGLYLLWNENQSLKSTLLQVTNQLGVVNEENQKLKQIILQTQQTAKTQSTQKLEKNVDRKTKDIAKIKEKTKKANSKEIVIVLPENEKNYAKVIPHIDYKHIPLDKDAKKEEENLKISPEVFIDKDEKKINGGKINIETKF